MPSQAQFFKLWMADGRIGARHARRIEPRGSSREDARSAPAAGILFVRPPSSTGHPASLRISNPPDPRADRSSADARRPTAEYAIVDRHFCRGSAGRDPPPAGSQGSAAPSPRRPRADAHRGHAELTPLVMRDEQVEQHVPGGFGEQVRAECRVALATQFVQMLGSAHQAGGIDGGGCKSRPGRAPFKSRMKGMA